MGTGSPRDEVVDLGDVTVVPGFVDLHSHGGGGASFTEGAKAAATGTGRASGARHHDDVASLVSDTVDRLDRQLRPLRPLVEAGDLAGIHLEGPWLSDGHPGAHDPAVLRDPSPADLDRLVQAGGGKRRDGDAGGRARGWARRTRATGDGRGAWWRWATVTRRTPWRSRPSTRVPRGATHLFNAERPIGHHEPGLVVALLEREEVVWSWSRTGCTCTGRRARRRATRR